MNIIGKLPENNRDFDHRLSNIDETLDEFDTWLDEKFEKIIQNFDKLKERQLCYSKNSLSI